VDSCTMAEAPGMRGSHGASGSHLTGGGIKGAMHSMKAYDRLGAFVTLAVTLAACGGPTPAKVAKQSDGDVAEVEVATQESGLEQKASEPVPNKCVKRKGACLPPVKWAERLCQDVYPDLALYMFREGSPWARFYMRTGLNAVNGWGSTLDENLVQGEEVIPINYRGQKDGLVVEGSEGTFDVLRWNGSCVTLDLAEVTKDRPGAPKTSTIDWRSLSGSVQEALLENDNVAEAVRGRQRECKGATIGRVSSECVRLDRNLGTVIAKYVRGGGGVPLPSDHP
jgi:hypothetical protein